MLWYAVRIFISPLFKQVDRDVWRRVGQQVMRCSYCYCRSCYIVCYEGTRACATCRTALWHLVLSFEHQSVLF